MLSFIVPVRHPAATADGSGAKTRLAATLRSVAGQSHDAWNGVVVANRGTDLPPLPRGFEVVSVDIPYQPLPNPDLDLEARYQAFRLDKGRRVFAGLQHLNATGHVMIVDDDDLISWRLAGFVAAHAAAPGWYFDTGYLYSGSRWVYHCPRRFSELCGTSHIIRADLLAPQHAADDEHIRRTLGSHIFIRAALAGRSSPLTPLPFAGAIYRVGHAGSFLASPSLRHREFPVSYLLRHPHRFLGRLTRLRPLTAGLKREFFGA